MHDPYHKKTLKYSCRVRTKITGTFLTTLVYETGGRVLLMLEVCVDIVSRVVTPNETRAGTLFASSQKLTHDTITSIQHGM